jgi:hypothetical protein
MVLDRDIRLGKLFGGIGVICITAGDLGAMIIHGPFPGLRALIAMKRVFLPLDDQLIVMDVSAGLLDLPNHYIHLLGYSRATYGE